MRLTSEVARLIPDKFQAAPGMTMLQNYAVRTLPMRVRFGLWDEILAAPAPGEALLHSRAIWHYARGRALAARRDLHAAHGELTRPREIAREAAAAQAEARLARAWAGADTRLGGSVF